MKYFYILCLSTLFSLVHAQKTTPGAGLDAGAAGTTNPANKTGMNITLRGAYPQNKAGKKKQPTKTQTTSPATRTKEKE